MRPYSYYEYNPTLFPLLSIAIKLYDWRIGLFFGKDIFVIALLPLVIRVQLNHSFYVSNVLGGPERDAVLFVWNLVHFRRSRLDLHWIKEPDRINFYHSHPARAYRVILWNGYVEQKVYRQGIDPHAITDGSTFVGWKFGSHGWVEPDFVHRIDYVPKGGSWSLWFRGSITHEIKVGGFVNGRFLFEEDGWIKEL